MCIKIKINPVSIRDIENIAVKANLKTFDSFCTLLINDLMKTGSRYVSIDIYARLGGWCNTGGSYIRGVAAAVSISEKILGYTIEKSFIINEVQYDIIDFRYENSRKKNSENIILEYHNQNFKDKNLN